MMNHLMMDNFHTFFSCRPKKKFKAISGPVVKRGLRLAKILPFA